MAAWSDHGWPAVEVRRFVVLVTLTNDQGHRTKLLGIGRTVDEAVADAERKMRENTGDESWTAQGWEAA